MRRDEGLGADVITFLLLAGAAIHPDLFIAESGHPGFPSRSGWKAGVMLAIRSAASAVWSVSEINAIRELLPRYLKASAGGNETHSSAVDLIAERKAGFTRYEATCRKRSLISTA